MKESMLHGKRKYRLYATLLIAFVAYLLMTEIPERIRSVYEEYENVNEGEKLALDPVTCVERKTLLLKRKAELLSLVRSAGSTSKYSATETGVLECLTDNAAKTRVKIASLIPDRVGFEKDVHETRFKLTLVGPYHAIGKFVNECETDGLTLITKNISLEKKSSGGKDILAHVELTSYLPEEEK